MPRWIDGGIRFYAMWEVEDDGSPTDVWDRAVSGTGVPAGYSRLARPMRCAKPQARGAGAG